MNADLITIAASVSWTHREAVLILGGIQKVANQRARRIGIAQGLGLERVDPRVEPRFIGIASQVGEILEQH